MVFHRATEPVAVDGFARDALVNVKQFAQRELPAQATYEATLLAAAEQAATGGSSTVLLTRVGGGVFNNDPAWIDDAIDRALGIVEHAGLDIRLVCYAEVGPESRGIVERWGRRRQ